MRKTKLAMDRADLLDREASMKDVTKTPDDCTTMAEVRNGVDAVDVEIGRLLALRFGFMRAAARIKSTRESIRDETRKAEVIENARVQALTGKAPEEAVARVYDRLVEESIAYEFEIWDQLRKA